MDKKEKQALLSEISMALYTLGTMNTQFRLTRRIEFGGEVSGLNDTHSNMGKGPCAVWPSATPFSR